MSIRIFVVPEETDEAVKLSEVEVLKNASILVRRFASNIVAPKFIVSLLLFNALIELPAVSFVKPASEKLPVVKVIVFAPSKFRVLPLIACATVKLSLKLITPFVLA